MDLKGRVAVVTGGSGTLGEATAWAFAAQGATVALTYVGERTHAEEIAAGLRAGPAGVSSAFHLDQSDPASVGRFVAEVLAHYGRQDIQVNNAAWNLLVPFADLEALTVELWDRITPPTSEVLSSWPGRPFWQAACFWRRPKLRRRSSCRR